MLVIQGNLISIPQINRLLCIIRPWSWQDYVVFHVEVRNVKCVKINLNYFPSKLHNVTSSRAPRPLSTLRLLPSPHLSNKALLFLPCPNDVLLQQLVWLEFQFRLVAQTQTGGSVHPRVRIIHISYQNKGFGHDRPTRFDVAERLRHTLQRNCSLWNNSLAMFTPQILESQSEREEICFGGVLVWRTCKQGSGSKMDIFETIPSVSAFVVLLSVTLINLSRCRSNGRLFRRHIPRVAWRIVSRSGRFSCTTRNVSQSCAWESSWRCW